jgi:hypothetical protein
LETGTPGGRSTTEGIRYEDMASVEKARSTQRILGRPTTLIDRPDREQLAIATLEGAGSAHEISERLAGELERTET